MCYIKKGIKRLICQIYRLLRNYTCTFRAEKFGDFLHNSKGGLGMIAIGADHGGYKLKEEIKKYFEENNIDYEDYGTYSEERTDYPIYAKKVAEAMVTGNADKGILICRSGYGMTVVANKFKGVRAASVTSVAYAKAAKADDDINLLTLSGDNTTIKEAIEMINAWLETEFKGGRYKERLDMLEKTENENMK